MEVKILLDTNAYVAFHRGPSTVADLVNRADNLIISAIVAGELLHGFHNGTHFMENRRRLEKFLAKPKVSFLPITLATADRFGRIMTQLKKNGRPIPTNDVWIAAHAMECAAELVTFDGHFEDLAGLATIIL